MVSPLFYGLIKNHGIKKVPIYIRTLGKNFRELLD